MPSVYIFPQILYVVRVGYVTGYVSRKLEEEGFPVPRCATYFFSKFTLQSFAADITAGRPGRSVGNFATF